ncbi:hypothetical protein B0H17DRAFT_1139928 [Mycena rosella]|uniref:Uncharacterized protein n=1 Tax=Mycena rosella TaxID=1033263 RepID=A0AAD7GBX6_MYCRO|nr:hypothetical protein B0H17DRAFT_1139928 [Mycena rosella]
MDTFTGIYVKLTAVPSLCDSIGIEKAMEFVRLAARLRDTITVAQSKDHDAEEAPEQIPDSVHDFLGTSRMLFPPSRLLPAGHGVIRNIGRLFPEAYQVYQVYGWVESISGLRKYTEYLVYFDILLDSRGAVEPQSHGSNHSKSLTFIGLKFGRYPGTDMDLANFPSVIP